MRKVRLRKKGISLVALVITIIVLIILTGAVVITGISVPKKAQLTVFYNNVATVQDAVSLQMSENMINGAKERKGENYKWYKIAEGYTDENSTEEVRFIPMLNVTKEKMVKIDSDLLGKTTLAEGEKTKYYVGESGTVYYEGFEYEGNTYYNKNTQAEGIGKTIERDMTVPTVSITANTEDVTNAASITYTITFSKSVSGFTKDDITINGVTNTIDISGNGAVYTVVVPTTEQEYMQTISVGSNVCEDEVGNTNVGGSKSVQVDRINPVVTNQTSTTAFKITIKATDGVGITGYAVTNSNTQPTEFTSCASTTELTQVVGGKAASTTYYVWVKDSVGNVSVAKEVSTLEAPDIITAEEIADSPNTYYGKTVTYMKEDNTPFTSVDGTKELSWRVFYSDGENIYLAPTLTVDKVANRNWQSVSEAITDMTTEKETYVNHNYANWSKDGITYTMLETAYNQVKDSYYGPPAALGLQGNESDGFELVSCRVDDVKNQLYNSFQLDQYVLASYCSNYSRSLLIVKYTNRPLLRMEIPTYYSNTCGLRPIVCLKNEVQLVEENGVLEFFE